MNTIDTTQITNLRTAYKRNGILELETYPRPLIEKWNTQLDKLFEQRASEERSYVRSHELASLGILSEAFTPSLRALVWSLDPTSVFYHCHAYEIAGNRKKPHINADENEGWHRDVDVPNTAAATGVFAFSLFIYLSPVFTPQAGAFEIVPAFPVGPLSNRRPSVILLGDLGYPMIWNRSFFHRANANQTSIRRRLLKFSFQSREFKNTHAEKGEFTRAGNIIGDTDPFLTFLLGQPLAQGGAELPPPEATAISFSPIQCNSRVSLSVKTRLNNFRRRLTQRRKGLVPPADYE